MGGHGGLNILPQKSWNVYNRDNRQKVAEDEAKAAAEAAAEARQENSERAQVGLQKLRKRAGSGPAVPQEHVNLFYVEERAQGNLEHQMDQKVEDARLVARVMPDLQLDRSSREPAPWYTKVSTPVVPEHVAVPNPPSRRGAAELVEPGPSTSRGELEEHPEHKRHKHDRHDRHDRHEKGHKRDKAHRHHKEHRQHKRTRAPELDEPADGAVMRRLRQERQERERQEQHRARSVVAYGQPEEAGRTVDRTQQVAQNFLQKTGQVVSLKPRPPGGAYRGSRR